MAISLIIGFSYFFYKIFYWQNLFNGITPLILLFTFLFSFVLFFMGVLGEYLLLLLSKLNTVPVVEEERINFDKK